MGCLLLLLLVGLTNNDALLLAFFFLGRPIWPTCMLASCSMYVLSRAGSLPPPTCSLHSCACRYLLSTTANTTQRRRAIIMRLSGSSSESCRCSHLAAATNAPRLAPFTGAAIHSDRRVQEAAQFLRFCAQQPSSPYFTPLFDRACQHACNDTT